MTTAQFIAKTFDTPSDRERRCSSVFTDYDGTVYSYGYHYPLLFKVEGVTFINNRGYSNTTAKHINWAWQAVNCQAIAIHLPSWVRYPKELKLDDIRKMLLTEHTLITDQMLAKKRKDTQVYAQLHYEASVLVQAITKVTEAM